MHVPLHTVVENGLNRWPRRLSPFPDILQVSRAVVCRFGCNFRKYDLIVQKNENVNRSVQASGYDTALFGKAGVMPLPTAFSPPPGAPGVRHRANSGDSDESWVLETMRTDPHERRTEGTRSHEFLEAFLVNRTIAWIRAREVDRAASSDEAGRRRPWFAHLSMLSPHGPNVIPVGFWNPWAGGSGGEAEHLPAVDVKSGDFDLLPTQTRLLLGIRGRDRLGDGGADPVSGEGEEHGLSVEVPGGQRFFPLGSEAATEAHRRRYYGQAAFVDQELGRLLHFLDNFSKRDLGLSELAQNTVCPANNLLNDTEHSCSLCLTMTNVPQVVVYTSDHGSLLYDHGLPDKHSLHTEALRVPLVVRWPGHLPAGVTAGVASLIDLPTTLLASAARAMVPASYQVSQGITSVCIPVNVTSLRPFLSFFQIGHRHFGTSSSACI